MARNRNIRSPLAEQAMSTFSSSSPGRLHFLDYNPPPVSPEYRGNPNDGHYNLGFVPETSQHQDLTNNMTNWGRYPTQGSRPPFQQLSKRSRRKTMKENLEELEASNASPVQIVEQMR